MPNLLYALTAIAAGSALYGKPSGQRASRQRAGVPASKAAWTPHVISFKRGKPVTTYHWRSNKPPLVYELAPMAGGWQLLARLNPFQKTTIRRLGVHASFNKAARAARADYKGRR
jgi:hypothetical protein